MSVTSYINEFRSIASAHPGPVDDSAEWVFGDDPQHLVFGMITHGNETGSLPAIRPFVDHLETQHQFKGKVSLFLGNVRAAMVNKRYTEADLNRVFTEQPSTSYERDRALELSTILKSASLLVDFHQTILASNEPFYIFPYHRPGYYWARLLAGAKYLVTRHPNYQFSAGSMCTDEYVLAHGGAGVTLEMGQAGTSDWATDLTLTTMKRALSIAASLEDESHLESLANQGNTDDLDFYEITYAEPFNDPTMCLDPDWINFATVKQGDRLGTNRDGLHFYAPKEGMLLFPKYPERDADGNAQAPIPKEIYNLASKMPGHPLKIWSEV